MKKYISVILKGRKEPIYLSIEKWQSILEDQKNLVAYTLDKETEWTGRVLNKLDVSYSEYDKDYSDRMNEEKYVIYRNKETNSVVKMLEGQLPDDFEKYERMK